MRSSAKLIGASIAVLALGCHGIVGTPPSGEGPSAADGAPTPGASSERPADPTPPPQPPPSAAVCEERGDDPGPTYARRLALWEYANLVDAAFAVDVRGDLEAGWPATTSLFGLSELAPGQAITPTHIEAFEAIAEAVSARVGGDRLLGACSDVAAASCSEDVSRDVMTKLLREEPTGDGVARFAAPMEAALRAGIEPAEAARWTLEAVLQSGAFLYRLEEQAAGSDAVPVSAHNLAGRIAFLVWGEGPDEALLEAAAAGELESEAGIRVQVARMVEDPRAIRQSRDFVTDWLGLGSVTRSDVANAYGEVDAAMLRELRDEALAMASDVFWERRAPVRELLTATQTIASERVASLYGLEPSAGGEGRYSLPRDQRGLLTRGAVLAQAGGAEESMITRGLFFLDAVLCSELPPRPDGLDISDDGSAETNTEREASEVRLSRGTCSACHQGMEPIAHGFEPLDGVGRFRDVNEDGYVLRADSTITLTATDETLTWDTTGELLEQLSESEAVGRCLVRKPLSFALGRVVVDAGVDACAVSEIQARADANGGSYPALLEAIATHTIFRTQRPREEN